jgi:hypothetical protein
MQEIWKDIPDYDGLYQVSNLGRVKSLPKKWISGRGVLRSHNGKILKCSFNNGGYCQYRISKNGITSTFLGHVLVAITFLNHKPNGHTMVVDHINDVKTDNRLENLQVVTHRYNCYKTQSNYTSKYKGVSWQKDAKKWRSRITIDRKVKELGYYLNEIDAYKAYENALQNNNLK